jgi:hypothetical protein
MIEAIATAIVDLARLALLAYVAKLTRDCFTHWLDAGCPGTVKSLEARILDAARRGVIDLSDLVQRQERTEGV